MSGQDGTTSTLDAAVDVVREIEQAQAAEDFRTAQAAVMASRIQLGAVTAYSEGLAVVIHAASEVVVSAPSAIDAAIGAVAAAAAEGRRLLALLGVDLPAEPGAPAGGD